MSIKLVRANGITREVDLRLPTENAGVFIEGQIKVKFRLLSKDAVATLHEEGLIDREFTQRVVLDVDGLCDENGEAIKGDSAMKEVLDGAWSAYLQAAILGDFFDHFGDARAKNSKTSRRR